MKHLLFECMVKRLKNRLQTGQVDRRQNSFEIRRERPSVGHPLLKRKKVETGLNRECDQAECSGISDGPTEAVQVQDEELLQRGSTQQTGGRGRTLAPNQP